MLAGKRAGRVGDQILKEVADLLMRKVKDPRVQGVTLSGIDLGNDLKMAKVYYSLIGGPAEIQKAQSGLESAKGFIKREVGRSLGLKYLPEILFKYDPSLAQGDHMEKIFEKIKKDEARAGTRSPDRSGQTDLQEPDDE
ncbi:MAG: 30S ribosome-binding factor RbfA [Desulfobacteraceae bacterium]|nr:MAG: 30S ribosome-binding factor RbfA [Desulfobacteraceae bacterium]